MTFRRYSEIQSSGSGGPQAPVGGKDVSTRKRELLRLLVLSSLAAGIAAGLYLPWVWSVFEDLEGDYSIGSALAESLVVMIGSFRGGVAAGLLLPDWRAALAGVLLVSVAAAVLLAPSGANIVGILLYSSACGAVGAGLGTAFRVALVSLYRLIRRKIV